MPAIMDETGSVASALAGIGLCLREIDTLAGLAENLAVRECREDEALERLRGALDDIRSAVINEAEPALSAAIEAEHDLVDRAEPTHAEHIAQERGMHRWRSVT